MNASSLLNEWKFPQNKDCVTHPSSVACLLFKCCLLRLGAPCSCFSSPVIEQFLAHVKCLRNAFFTGWLCTCVSSNQQSAGRTLGTLYMLVSSQCYLFSIPLSILQRDSDFYSPSLWFGISKSWKMGQHGTVSRMLKMNQRGRVWISAMSFMTSVIFS